MSDTERQDQLFGDIAIQKQMITRDKIERALVIQRCINNRTRVYMPIGAVLQKMGVLAKEQIDQILAEQNNGTPQPSIENPSNANTIAPPTEENAKAGINLVISSDKLTATIEPATENQAGPPLETVKLLLVENNITFGVVSDKLLSTYLEKNPLPIDPFVVARGTPCVPGKPPETQYYFDTDPMRIGTLLEDGSMDWKNRGEIPQVTAGDLLAEKVGGDPGKPGTDLFGQEIAPPRIKDPPLKFTKGAMRSEDGRQILAKLSGTPKLGADGRIGVSSVLPIETDIGIETGNIDFEGHIEVSGCIESGYTVKGGSLNTREIQNATIEINEDLVSFGGIYGSTIKAGGHLKASHIHNSIVEVVGDLVVEKEIFGCTIEVNGRCLIDSGKIIGSKISAKKGVQVKDIGTRAAKPSELTVGVDFKFERDLKACKEEIAELDRKKSETETAITNLKKRVDGLDAELGQVAQEQDGCMVQKRQLEEKLKGPAIAKNPEKLSLLEELIGDLAERYDSLDKRVHAIMAQDDLVRAQIEQNKNNIVSFDKQIAETAEQAALLEEAAKVDPGIPVVKANGMVYSKTLVVGPHRKIIIPQEMKCVRIAESQEDPKQYQMKVSNLR